MSFKEKIYKLLQKVEPTLDNWYCLIQLHSANGKHPDFHNYQDPKTLCRIVNYMESILNTKVSQQYAIELCKKLTAKTE
jgi:hypothetical protein